MQKKLFVVLSILILASLVLTACGTPAPKDVTLTLGSWRTDDVAAWEAITTAFHAKYPNITVKFDPTNPPDYNATLRSQLETGTGPDLFFVRSFGVGRELFDAGYIASLKDLPGINDTFSAGARRLGARASWARRWRTHEPCRTSIPQPSCMCCNSLSQS